MDGFTSFINPTRLYVLYLNYGDNSIIITVILRDWHATATLNIQYLYYLVIGLLGLFCVVARGLYRRLYCNCTYRFRINKRHEVDRKISHNTTQFTGVRHSFSCCTQHWRIHGSLGHRETPASERRGCVNLWRIWLHDQWYEECFAFNQKLGLGLGERSRVSGTSTKDDNIARFTRIFGNFLRISL